ncbi:MULTISPECIES: ash family protein [unclassified Lonepinella]|uniref:ash family protein n=1 Tax=unclassified Lonepinella TaxID=2642006 RepID=UPI0036DB8F83
MPKIKAYARFNMKLNHSHYSKHENNSQYIFLTKCGEICDSFHALAKSSAEPRNSNDLSVANDSTPIYHRAFFVRSIRTPEENNGTNFGPVGTLSNEVAKLKFEPSNFLSMVACNGKGLALCCVPLIAVFEPVTRYRPKASKLQAVTSTKRSSVELSAMIYLFLGIHRQNLGNTSLSVQRLPKARIVIQADNESTARAKIAKDYCLLQCWNVKNPEHLHRTLTNVKGVIYA